MDEIAHPFARVTMEGESFERGRLPVRSLEELQRYQGLVIEAAKLLWKDDHPGEELPQHFEQSFELTLTAIEPGSAVSVLERPGTSDFETYFAAGRDELEREFSIALATEPDFEKLPLLEFPAFQSFGTSLASTERITLPPPRDGDDHAKNVVITKEISQKVIKPLAENFRKWKSARYTENSWVAGRLIAINADKLSFSIKTLNNVEISGKYRDAEKLVDLKAVLGSSSKAPVVRLRGDLRFANEKLDRILDVHEVELFEVDGEPWSRRLIELASLPQGWHEESPNSQAIAFPALDGAREILRTVQHLDLPLPGLFPVDDGSVNIEWASPDFVVSIEVDPDVEFSIFETGRDRKTNSFVTENLEEVFGFLGQVSL